MQTQFTQQSSVGTMRRTARQPQDVARDPGHGAYAGGLARNAAAATELPFSALFYWVD